MDCSVSPPAADRCAVVVTNGMDGGLKARERKRPQGDYALMAIWDTASGKHSAGKKSDEQSAMGSFPDENELISEWMHRFESKLTGMFVRSREKRLF